MTSRRSYSPGQPLMQENHALYAMRAQYSAFVRVVPSGAPGLHDDLGVPLRRAQLDEGAGHAVQTHVPRDEGRGRDAVGGDVAERRLELVRRVAQDELEGQLLADAEHG